MKTTEYLLIQDRFIVDVMAVSGRTKKQAFRLFYRLLKLSISSKYYNRNLDWYLREWLDRYISGWGSIPIRYRVFCIKGGNVH